MIRTLGLPKWLIYALTMLPILALWAVNVWAINDYIRHKESQSVDQRVQAVRDTEQDRDMLALRQQIERQQRVTCAIATRLKVVSLDCE